MSVKYFLFSVIVMALISCDRIEDPYEGVVRNDIDTTSFCGIKEIDLSLNDTMYNDTSTNYRKLLFEEYTGHTCGNCPKFTKKLVEKVENDLSEKSVMVSIHAGPFAALDEKYTTDFTTDEGNELLNRFKVNSYPGLIVNRANKPISGTLWDGFIDSLKTSGVFDEPLFKFNLMSVYNPPTRKGQLYVETTILKDMQNTNLVVGLIIVEDKVVAKQTDYSQTPEDVPDYEHRFVLRNYETSVFGSSLIQGDISANKKQNQVFCYDIDNAWIDKNVKLIAFVGDADNNQILQAEQISIAKE